MSEPAPRKVKLTALGDLVMRHNVLTSTDWWMKAWKETNRIADQDGEWQMFLDEKIAGLTEMRDRFYELNNEPTRE